MFNCTLILGGCGCDKSQLINKLEDDMKSKSTSYNQKVSSIWTTKHIKAEVIFGSPKHRCQGVGICKVMPLFSTQETRRPIAYISILSNEKIKFEFLKDSLNQDMLETHFKDMLFIVVDEFYFSDVMLKRIKKDALSIAPGMYNIKETEHFYTIIF
ncbi:MAG: hypothetical protein AAF806_03725 [Bacteroidota bacterium]